jgi:maltose alpha-D-glucosyltransferase/alpha-amylase
MLRSFDYAAIVARSLTATAPTMSRRWRPGRGCGISGSVSRFCGVICKSPAAAGFAQEQEDLKTLLDILVLDKAVYELSYELNNRPDWVDVPLRGILGLLKTNG